MYAFDASPKAALEVLTALMIVSGAAFVLMRVDLSRASRSLHLCFQSGHVRCCHVRRRKVIGIRKNKTTKNTKKD